MSTVGPPFKTEEIWTSKDLFIYGKYLIYKGCALPMSLKKVCKTTRLSNEDYPTLESPLSSLTANLSAAIASSSRPNLSYFNYLLECIATLQIFFRTTYR